MIRLYFHMCLLHVLTSPCLMCLYMCLYMCNMCIYYLMIMFVSLTCSFSLICDIYSFLFTTTSRLQGTISIIFSEFIHIDQQPQCKSL